MDESKFLILEKEIGENEVVVGLESTPEQTIGRLEVVTGRYIREGYLQGAPYAYINGLLARDVVAQNGIGLLYDALDEELFKKLMDEGLLLEFNSGEKLYLDKYHWNSMGFVAQTKAGYVGSVRLIMNDGVSSLPTLADESIVIDSQWREKITDIDTELSQFAVKKGIDTPTHVSLSLLRIAAQYSRANEIKQWLATTDNSVVRLLNGFMFNFDLPKIGPSVKYLGSQSTPVLIDIEQAIANASKKPASQEIAEFLRGKNDVKGFEWYTGV